MAKKIERLVPGTSILEAMWNHKMSTEDALSEFIDNSFGEAAGNARRCQICFFKRTIEVIDTGEGIKDMDAMFQLAQSGSRSHESDIGRYGIGAKYAMTHFGKKVKVQTVHDGLYHQRTIDWNQVHKTGLWPYPYGGTGSSRRNAPVTIRNHGTIITISDFIKGRRRPIFDDLAKRLALRYRPLLRSGREISIEDLKSGFDVSLSERLLSAHFTGEEMTQEGIAADRPFKLHYAKIREYDKAVTGLHIAFGHRVIVHKDKLGDRTLPAQFYAEVTLSNKWKDCLSPDKTAITRYEDELLEALLRLLQSVITELDRTAQEIRITNILSLMSGTTTNLLRLRPRSVGEYQRIKPEPKEREKPDVPKPVPEPTPDDRERSQPRAEFGGKKDVEQDPPNGHTIIKFDLRDNIGVSAFRVEWNHNQCTVALNKQIETIAYAFQAPFKMAVIWPIIAAAFAYDCAEREHPEEMFIESIGLSADARSEIIPRVMKWVLDQRKADEDFNYEQEARLGASA
jgi:hypothetical protein